MDVQLADADVELMFLVGTDVAVAHEEKYQLVLARCLGSLKRQFDCHVLLRNRDPLDGVQTIGSRLADNQPPLLFLLVREQRRVHRSDHVAILQPQAPQI